MAGGGNSLHSPSSLASSLSSVLHLSLHVPQSIYTFLNPHSADTPPPPPARVHAHTHTRQCFHLNPNWALPSQMPSADPIPIFLIISSYCCSAHPPTLDTHLHAQTDTHTQFLLKNNMKSCRMEKLDKAKGVVLGSSRFLTTLQHTLLHSAFVCVFVCPHVHVCSCLPVGLSQTSQAH